MKLPLLLLFATSYTASAVPRNVQHRVLHERELVSREERHALLYQKTTNHSSIEGNG